MFHIDRKNPWPPGIDLATTRMTIRKIEREMQRVPQFADIAAALKEALLAIDKAETKCPRRLGDKVFTHSRFTPLTESPLKDGEKV